MVEDQDLALGFLQRRLHLLVQMEHSLITYVASQDQRAPMEEGPLVEGVETGEAATSCYGDETKARLQTVLHQKPSREVMRSLIYPKNILKGIVVEPFSALMNLIVFSTFNLFMDFPGLQILIYIGFIRQNIACSITSHHRMNECEREIFFLH